MASCQRNSPEVSIRLSENIYIIYVVCGVFATQIPLESKLKNHTFNINKTLKNLYNIEEA